MENKGGEGREMGRGEERGGIGERSGMKGAKTMGGKEKKQLKGVGG